MARIAVSGALEVLLPKTEQRDRTGGSACATPSFSEEMSAIPSPPERRYGRRPSTRMTMSAINPAGGGPATPMTKTASPLVWAPIG